MVLASATMVSMLASDSDGSRFLARPGVAVDSTGRISIHLPETWQTAGGRWKGPANAGGQDDPALVVSPDPVRWGTDPTVRGAFIWLSRSGAAFFTPAAFVAGRTHAGCAAAPVRTSRQAGIDWVIAEYRCSDGRGRVVEAAGTGSGDAGLVYVQIARPADSESTFVDSLLAGVRVR
jgi:hypothetical protein